MTKKTLIFYILLYNLVGLFAQEFKEDINSSTYNMEVAAYTFYNNGVYDSAEYYYLRVIDIYRANKIYDDKTAAIYLNLGAVYRSLYHYDKSLECLKTAEHIYNTIDPSSVFLGYINNNKANIYYSYSDFAEAERYYRYTVEFFEKANHTNTVDYQKNVLNIFNLLVSQNKIKEAEAMIPDLFKIDFNEEQEIEKHLQLSQAYNQLGKEELALEHLSLSKQKLIELNLTSNAKIVRINYIRASILINLERIQEAHTLLLHNVKLLQENSIIDFKNLARTYYYIGTIQYMQNNNKGCMKWLLDAEKDLVEKLEEANIDIKNSSQLLNLLLAEIRQLAAKNYEELYTQTGDTKYLNAADHLYKTLIEDTKFTRIHMRNEESKYYESESKIDIINDAIRIAINLYNETNDETFLYQAFYYAENVKSFALLSEITNNQAIQFADLPTHILSTEERLTNEIAAYEELIFSEKTASEIDTSRLIIFKEKLFQLKDDYNDFLDEIESEYPNYFELKYNPHFVTPPDVQQKLHRKDALVEYVLTDSILYTFIIDRQQTQILEAKISETFADDCFNYFTILESQDFNQNVHQTYKDFVQLGRMFYQTLVEPVLEVTESREITFVPDGAIMYLPFESFITEDVDLEYVDYHNLPYMIYDVSVGYSYSSTLLFKERIKTKSPERKVLAFAPAYENLQSEVNPLIWNRHANPDYLVPLKGAREEVQNIAKAVPSVTYMDYEATESNFKKYAPDYSILHLAMHTIMNDDDPMNSKLAFARNFEDTTQDHDLFTYEIYNMQLNTDMVVLSSCSSGYGKIQRGEGMMSMARGFIYAGCPSIIMTLWQVSDKSSSELMSSFYKHLKKGKSKKKALRQAKIDYIQSSDKIKSNPYFWSAFMVVGDSSPLYGASPATIWSIIIASFLIIVIFFYYRKTLVGWLKRK